MLLAGKVALVTGGAQGIGEASALTFAREGADVLIADINVEGAGKVAEQIRAMGRRSVAVSCDISSREQVFEAVSAAVRQLGRLDIMMNNAAGGGGHNGPFHEWPQAAWERGLSVDLNGTVWGCQAALDQMVRQNQGGKIINLSSVHSLITGSRTSHYIVAKAGINMLTKGLAVEYAPYKINVNAIGPGAIATPTIGKHTTETIKAYERRVPWGQRGVPQDIANAALFLASSLSDYMTGQTVYVDGGYTIDGTLTDFKPEKPFVGI